MKSDTGSYHDELGQSKSKKTTSSAELFISDNNDTALTNALEQQKVI